MAENDGNTAPTCEKTYQLNPEQRVLLRLVGGVIEDVKEEATEDLNPEAAEILALCRSALVGLVQRQRQEPSLGDLIRTRLAEVNHG